jgi:large subunit ribosomal protein L9
MTRTGSVKAILLVDVEHLGHRGDVVSVARGYLRNYLQPRHLAEQASPARIAEVERVRAQRTRQEAKSVDEAREIAKVIDRTVLQIPARSGPDGRLYGSVTSADLADEVWRTRKIRIDRRKVRLDEPIKALGDYLIEIDLFPEVRANLRVSVAQAEGFDTTATAVDAEPAPAATAATAAAE